MNIGNEMIYIMINLSLLMAILQMFIVFGQILLIIDYE